MKAAFYFYLFLILGTQYMGTVRVTLQGGKSNILSFRKQEYDNIVCSIATNIVLNNPGVS